MMVPFVSLALSLVSALYAQSEGIMSRRAKAHASIERLNRQLDSREAAELSLLALDLAAEEWEQGSVAEAFAVLGPAIHFQTRCLESGLSEPEPARVLLASLQEHFGVALTHLGEFELAMAAFSFAEDEAGKLIDRRTPRFPPGSPSRDAEQQQGALAIRRAAARRAAGDPQGAWESLEQLRKTGKVARLDREGSGLFSSERGNALEDLGRFAEALEDYAQARSAWKELGDRKREFYELKTAGDALRRAGNPQEALRRYEEAHALAEGISFSPLERHENDTGFALVLADLDRRDEALQHLEASLDQLENYLDGLRGAESIAMRSRSFPSVSAALGAWARLRFEKDGQSMARASLSRIDRWRGMGLSRAPSPRQEADAIAADLENERSQFRRELQMHSGDPGAREGLRRTLSRLDLRLMGVKLPRSLEPSTTVFREAGQAKMPDGGVLCEYFAGPESVFLWVLDQNDCRWFSLARGKKDTEEFLRSVESLSEGIAKHSDGFSPSGEIEELSRKLIPAALLGTLASSRFLWVVPDAQLHQVPWTALCGAGALPRMPIAVLPSAAFGFRRETTLAPKPGGAVFAAPAAPTEGFEPLRFSQREGRAIAAMFPSAKLELAQRASEHALRMESQFPGALLHISSHGIFSRALQNGSALLLSPGDREDGWLWASEVESLSFPGRLVVLSSCHSGEGEWIPAEGVCGLSRAFLLTGARAVIGSLWAVDQEPTTIFMEEFYRQLAQGQSAGEAVANAPQALRGRQYAGSRFWAGFQLYGDLDWRLPAEMLPHESAPAPQPAPQSSVISYGFWGLFAGALALLVLLTRRKAR